MLFIGIDAGVTGALCALDEQGSYVDGLRLDHGDGSEIRDWLEKHRPDILLAAVEQVSSMPRDGGVQAFEFGRQFERQCMALVCLRIPFQLVTPQKWQAAAGVVKPAPVSAAEMADTIGKLDETDARIAAMSDQERAALRVEKRLASAKRKSKMNFKKAIADHARNRWPNLPMRVQDDWALGDAAFVADFARKVHQGAPIAKVVRAPYKARAV